MTIKNSFNNLWIICLCNTCMLQTHFFGPNFAISKKSTNSISRKIHFFCLKPFPFSKKRWTTFQQNPIRLMEMTTHGISMSGMSHVSLGSDWSFHSNTLIGAHHSYNKHYGILLLWQTYARLFAPTNW